VTSSTDRTYKKFSPMIGLVVSPSQQVSLYANFGQAFAPPSTTVPGDLKAEESTQFEFGIKNRLLDGKLHFNVAVYSLERENIPIRSSFGPQEEIGSQKSRGLELEISGNFGQGLFGFLSYAFTDAELTKFTEFSLQPFGPLDFSGKTAAFAPEHILNFWITKEFSNGLGIAGGGRYLSSQFIAPDNQFEIDSALTFDATLSYRFNRFRWSVNLKNLTDKKFETRGFRNTSVIPANPFAVYGSLDFSL
ncbi:TonB-dependent receptor, partial [candidate division KSB1 bacterium]|nr:TonB-dependent receptor [candidate division KSB1 bacterium]